MNKYNSNSTNNSSRDIQNNQGVQIGNNNNQVISNVTNNYIANHTKNHSITKIVKQEETTLKKEITVELIKAAIGAVFSILGAIERLDIIEIKSAYLVVLMMFSLLLGMIILISAVYRIICFLVNYQQQRIFKIGPIITTRYNIQNYRYYRYTKEGVLYRIRSCQCPLCETEPKGCMRIQPNPLLKTDVWVCNENPDHMLCFDPKEHCDYQ